jgi:hypothetical protein
MTLRNYVTDVVRCENTFILRNQQMEDDTAQCTVSVTKELVTAISRLPTQPSRCRLPVGSRMACEPDLGLYTHWKMTPAKSEQFGHYR